MKGEKAALLDEDHVDSGVTTERSAGSGSKSSEGEPDQ